MPLYIAVARGVSLLAITTLSSTVTAQSSRDWMFGPFEKPRDVNPVIAPSPTATLRSPMTDSLVQWEAYATFNPAAVVRNGRVMPLYRAEDATGVAQIGGHTSRLGLAEGGRPTRRHEGEWPVLDVLQRAGRADRDLG